MTNKWLLSVALGATLLSGSVFAADTLRIGTEGAYAPYNFINDDGKLAGFEIDLGNALCKEVDMECEFIKNDWDSIIPNLIAGNYDIIMAGMSITDERKKTIAFSEEYKAVDPSIYAALKDTKIDFEKLDGKSIGVQGSTIQASFLEEKYGKTSTIKSYGKPDQAVADLAAGNVDIMLADGEFVRTVTGGSNGMLVIVGPEEMIGGGIGIGMRQDAEKLKDKLNAGIAAMKADGRLDVIMAKYFKDVKPYKTN